jgi:hypothetical protein
MGPAKVDINLHKNEVTVHMSLLTKKKKKKKKKTLKNTQKLK